MAVTLRTRSSRRLVRSSLWLVPALVVVLVGSWLALAVAPGERERVVDRWRAQLVATADDREVALNTWLYERFGDAAVVAESADVKALFASADSRGAPETARQDARSRVVTFLQSVVDAHGYRSAVVLARDETALAVAGQDWSSDPACLELPRRVLASDHRLAEFHRHLGAVPVVQFGVPVRLAGGARPSGVVVLTLDPEKWLYPFVSHNAVLSESAETLLLRRDGPDALFLTPLRHRTVPPVTFRRRVDEPGFAAAAALSGMKEVFREYTDYRGVPVFAVTRRLEGAPWGLVTKVDREEVLLPYTRWRVRALAGEGLLFVALVGVVYGVRRYQMDRVRDAITASERRLGDLIHRANDAVFVFAADGQILQANERAEEMYGYSPEEFRRLTSADIHGPTDEAGAQDTLRQIVERGRLTLETRHQRRDGTEFAVELSARHTLIHGEELLIATVRDITLRKEAEDRIDRLNRLLRTISALKQAIIRERNRDRLFSEVCRILVESAGFRMAWVGVPDWNTRDVVPVAMFGTGAEFLEDARIRFDDSPLGMSPTGTAVRERRTVVVDDWANDPSLEPWRSTGHARGFRAAAAFPLLGSGAPLGVLAVYSGVCAAFDDETVTLLEEWAGDLAYALDALDALAGKRRLAAVLENVQDAYFQADLDGRLERVSSSAASMYGYASANDMIGLASSELSADPADRDSIVAELRRNGWVNDRVELGRRRDGRVFHVSLKLRLYQDEWGEIAGTEGFVRDISERMAADLALRESEDRFKSFFEFSVIGTAITSPIGDWQVNRAFADMLGYSREELLHRRWHEIAHPDDAESVRGMVESQLSGSREPVRFVKRLLHKTGTVVWTDLSTVLRRGENDEPLYFITTASDITVRILAEEEIQRLNDELEQRILERTADLQTANQELEAFSYSVAHDLRGPLRSIDGFSLALLEDHAGQLDSIAKSHLDRVRGSAQHMSRLIDDLLDLSYVGRKPMTIEAVASRALVDVALDALRSEQADRQVTVSVGELPDCQGDTRLLSMVWTNLLANALKYTGRQPAAVIDVGGGSDGQEVVYFVKDNGAGFDMRYVGKLFGVFQRLHSGSEFPGTGVGLALVQRIVCRHGGRVWADGEVDKGATFHFTLPIRDIRAKEGLQ